MTRRRNKPKETSEKQKLFYNESKLLISLLFVQYIFNFKVLNVIMKYHNA